jgi:hypothetical protein
MVVLLFGPALIMVTGAAAETSARLPSDRSPDVGEPLDRE